MASFCVLPYILCVYVVFHLIFSTTLCTLGVYMDIRELISLYVKTKINVVLLFYTVRPLSLSLYFSESAYWNDESRLQRTARLGPGSSVINCTHVTSLG